MLRYATVFTLCLLVSLKLGNAGECEERRSCSRALELNVTLPETGGSVAAGKTLELNCTRENIAVNCDGCCTAWGLRNGKDNVTSLVLQHNTGAPRECFCCTMECS